MALRYILSSNFPQAGNDQIARVLSDAGILGPIAWMAPEPSVERFARAREEFELLKLGPLVDISSSGAAGIRGVAAVYLSGGNPLAFRGRLQESGMTKWLRTNDGAPEALPVIAASGGAMQLTGNLSVFRLLSLSLDQVLDEQTDFEGLGLVPFEVIPHFNTLPMHLLATARRYAKNVDRSVWGLPDGCAVAVSHSAITPVGAAIAL